MHKPLITPEEIRTTAEMARLLQPEAGIPALQSQLSDILAYADKLKEVDVTGVLPTTHAVPMSCPLRADVTTPHDPIESALRNAPAKEGTFFAVPAVFAGAPSTTAVSDDYFADGEG